MKKFKKENKSKGNKVLRAREGDFLTDVSDVSDVSEDYSKYLNPLYPAFSVLRATGKALHKYSPQSKRTSFEEQAFKNAMGNMVQGIKVPTGGLKKTADAVVSVSPPIAPSTITPQSKKVAPSVRPVAPEFLGYPDYDEMTAPSPVASSPASVDGNAMEQYRNATPSSMKDLSAFLKKAAKAPDAPPELAKAAEEIPKTKSGMKKFMDEYGKFIALGAMAGTGGKAGRIAAPIIAALPGLIEMMKKKKKPQFDEKPMSAPGVQVGMAHGGSMKKGTKKFAEGGKTNSGDRESAFRRLKPTYSGLSFLGTTTPLREDSISKKLMREEDLSYYPFADSEQQRNDKDMKHALASIIDEMYNEKNKLPAMQSEYLPMVIKQSKKDRGTYGFPYDSKIFKELQKGHIQSGKKSSGGEPPKKSEGGAIRKFKGGSMKGNTMDSTLTPKYAKGGDMPKGMSKGKMGKAAGEMPQHKKMAMGKPTPQSMGQKFAKGGAAKYASGGMCKGYGIAKKIRPTGPMN